MLRSFVEKVERFPTDMELIPEGSGRPEKCSTFLYDVNRKFDEWDIPEY